MNKRITFNNMLFEVSGLRKPMRKVSDFFVSDV